MFQKYCLKFSDNIFEEKNSQNYLTYSLYCRAPSIAPFQTDIRATCEGTVSYYNVLFEFLGLFPLGLSRKQMTHVSAFFFTFQYLFFLRVIT